MDQICFKCGAASFKDETPQWCCDKGKTDVVAPESEEEDPTYDGAETASNGSINPDEDAINKILHSVRPGTTQLTQDSHEYRTYSVQYNNAISMASQQVTLDRTVAPYTCKIQGGISTHMPALLPNDGERPVHGQIYTLDSSQDQAITR